MTHYLRTDDDVLKFKVDMGCNHPDMKGNNTESVGCNGECSDCSHSVAKTTIPEMLELLRRAGCILKQ